MTDELITNDKQAMNALKQHGGNIVWVIIVVLAGYFGWEYYQKNYAKIDYSASDAYATIVSHVSQANDKTYQQIDDFVKSHPDSVYAWQLLMHKAKLQADGENYKDAKQSLEAALKVPVDEGFKAITSLQLASVNLALGDLQGALALLNQTYPKSFEPSRLTLLGDAYYAKNDEANAKQSYEQAWQLSSERGENRALLALKMQMLGMTPTPTTEAPH